MDVIDSFKVSIGTVELLQDGKKKYYIYLNSVHSRPVCVFSGFSEPSAKRTFQLLRESSNG